MLLNLQVYHIYHLEDYNRYKIETLISGIMFLKNIKILSFYSINKII